MRRTPPLAAADGHQGARANPRAQTAGGRDPDDIAVDAAGGRRIDNGAFRNGGKQISADDQRQHARDDDIGWRGIRERKIVSLGAGGRAAARCTGLRAAGDIGAERQASASLRADRAGRRR
jgi:hypothetical protein